MAHQLEVNQTTGKASMFFVGATPWHKLGTRFATAPTVAEAKTAAMANWTVGMKPLFTADGEAVPASVTYRMDTGAQLGVVGPKYVPLQNEHLFDWFGPLVEAGLVELHTAGVLFGGRKVWCLGRISGPNLEVRDGDEIERFVLLSNAHDGSRAMRCGFTPIRVVCANTEAMAINSEESSLVRCLHTKSLRQSLEALRDVMDVANSQFVATVEQYRRLAACPINRTDLSKYVRTVLGIKPDEVVKGPTQSKIGAIIGAAMEGKGTDGKTLWDAYNGVTQWLSYSASRTDDRRIDSLWFGENAALSKRALTIAVELAG